MPNSRPRGPWRGALIEVWRRFNPVATPAGEGLVAGSEELHRAAAVDLARRVAHPVDPEGLAVALEAPASDSGARVLQPHCLPRGASGGSDVGAHAQADNPRQHQQGRPEERRHCVLPKKTLWLSLAP